MSLIRNIAIFRLDEKSNLIKKLLCISLFNQTEMARVYFLIYIDLVA